MQTIKRFAPWAIILCSILSIFYFALDTAPANAGIVEMNEAPREFTLQDFNNQSFKLSDMLKDGQPVVLNFFASWCAPCRVEHEVLVKLSKQHNVKVYGIAYSDRLPALERYLKELGNPYERIGMDQTGAVAIDYGLKGVPETFVIDKDGRIRYKFAGVLTWKIAENVVLPLLASLR